MNLVRHSISMRAYGTKRARKATVRISPYGCWRACVSSGCGRVLYEITRNEMVFSPAWRDVSWGLNLLNNSHAWSTSHEYC